MKNYGSWMLILAIIQLVESEPPNLYLLQNGSHAYCVIANETENTAITLTKNGRPIPGYMGYPNNTFFCKTSIERHCERAPGNGLWKYDVSQNYDLPPITDRRWEALPLIRTNTNARNIDLVNVYNISELTYDFKIKLTVKIISDAYVFVCDGTYPPDSNCYWFIIFKWGKVIYGRLLKCEKNTVADVGIYLEDKCRAQYSITTHPTPPVNINEWSDFLITKSQNIYTVKYKGQDFLNYEDTNTPHFHLNYVLIASEVGSASEWKINDSPTVHRTGKLYNTNLLLKNQTGTYSFSVLPQEAFKSTVYIYLCEDNPKSPCYRISLRHHTIPTVCTLRMSFTDCDKNIKTYHAAKPTFLSWNHITLKIEDIKYEVISNGDETLVQFSNNNIQPKQILISSDIQTFWKIHSYGVFTTSNSGDTSINLNKGYKDQRICVAIFVQSCQKCDLTVQLQDENNNVLDTQTQSNKNIWEEIILTTILQKETKMELKVKLSTTDDGRAFIGDIRDCSNNIRIISNSFKKGNGNNAFYCSALKFPEVNPTENLGLLIIPSYSSGTVDVTWLNPDGDTRYELQTQLNYEGCNTFEKLDPEKDFSVGLLSGKQLKLMPYTTYKFQLLDADSKQVFSTKFHSNAEEVVSNTEIPEVQCTQEDENLVVNLTIRDCKNIRGPLYYHVQSKCTNDWCINLNPDRTSIPAEMGSWRIRDILGLSHYTVSLGVSRIQNAAGVENRTVCDMYAKPTAPPRVLNITIYSVTNNSISIRWKEPYPKTGELEKYVIEYKGAKKGDEWKTYNISVPAIQCKVWQEYFCASIKNLTQDIDYTIKVMAKNKEVEKLSFVKDAYPVTTKEKAPNKPANLAIYWDDHLNLTVTCEYPFGAIGPIRQLHIIINDTEFSFDLNDDLKSYSQQIDASKFCASRLNVTVKFSNFAGNSSDVINVTYSPPKTPKILNGSIQRMGNELYLNTDFIENLDGRSDIFVYQRNCSEKNLISLKGTCADIETLSKNSILLTHTSIEDPAKMTRLGSHFEIDPRAYFIALLRNSYEDTERCAVFSEISLFELNDAISPTVWIAVVLFLLCSCAGIIFYMYKKQRISFARTSLPVIFSRGPERVSEQVDVENQKFSRSIQIEKLQEYLTKSLNTSELSKQYNDILNIGARPQTVGVTNENMYKNRSEHTFAYDETGVKLDPLYCNDDFDYINANYIKGFNKEKAYIATQGPMVHTQEGFWRMVWQEGVECIVMLTRLQENGKKRCEMYWPALNETRQYGHFEILCTNTRTDDATTLRTLLVSTDSLRRKVTQIHYEGWPDKGVPASPEELKNLLCFLEDFHKKTKPVVIHSSAGTGRTGTFILADIGFRSARLTGTVDMFAILHQLRQQRVNKVENLKQYIYAHEVVAYAAEPFYHIVL